MLLAGNPEQPGHAVRRAEVVPDALALDAGHVDPALRQPPQGRRAEAPRPITTTSLRMISTVAGYAPARRRRAYVVSGDRTARPRWPRTRRSSRRGQAAGRGR